MQPSWLKTFQAQNLTCPSAAMLSSVAGLEGACGSVEALGCEAACDWEGGWGGLARIIKRCSRGSQ